MKPLPGGLKLDRKKEATTLPWTISRPAPPRRVILPLWTSQGELARPCVNEGSHVCVGEKIAALEGSSGLSFHASISGKVSRIGERIEIISEGKEEMLATIGKERPGGGSLSGEEIISLLRASGLEVPTTLSSKVLLLNACESEPYVTSAYSLVMSHPVEILRGGELLLRAAGAQELLLAFEEDQEEAVELIRSKVFFHSWSHARIESLPPRYPQGEKTLLAHSLCGRTEGVEVLSVAEAYAAYEAVALQKPFYERVVTIAGECVAQPRNFWIRIGTPVAEAVKFARGFLREPGKVIQGGPMTGRAVETLEEPILKETSAVLGLPRELTKPETVEPCIRCHRCVESCPVSLNPAMITLAAEKDLFDLAQDYDASFCIECGNCTYVCPAKRPMAELIEYANAQG